MRWMMRERGDERGAIIVLAAVLTVVMVGMAALVIDVGAILDEKRQLQNGADAAALAVARSCARGEACTQAAADSISAGLVRDNSGVNSATVDLTTSGQVKVVAGTGVGSTGVLPFKFGQILTGKEGQRVEAEAVVRWGPAGRGTVVRLAVSECDVRRLGTSSVVSVIRFQGGSACTAGRDGAGAFGWLDPDGTASPCELTVSAGGTPSVDPGTSGPTQCLEPYRGKEILLPVFDDVIGITGTGTNAFYTIKGFARFHLTDFAFGGNRLPACGNDNCITGYFVRYVTVSQVLGGTDYGVSVVKLIS